MDIYVHGVNLVSIIFQTAFAQDIQTLSVASWCGDQSYNSRSHLLFMQGKVNSALYITQVVNPVLLPFLRQEGDVLFQQDNEHPRNVFFVLYTNCPGQ